MDFMKKNFARIGKQAESYLIIFKPLLLKVNVFGPSHYYLVFKRGPQKDETKRYKLEPPTVGCQMLQLEFEDEKFSRVSSFYKEKDGKKYQSKFTDIKIMCQNAVKEEKVSEVQLNVSPYIGRGTVKDQIQLNGNAYVLHFEICVEPADMTMGGQRISFSQTEISQSRDSDDDNDTNYSDRKTFSSNSNNSQVVIDINQHQLKQSNTVRQQNLNGKHENSEHNDKQQTLIQVLNQDNQLQNEVEYLRKELEKMKLEFQQVKKKNTELEEKLSRKDNEIELLKIQEEVWKQKCDNLQKDVENLKKDQDEFYSADRF